MVKAQWQENHQQINVPALPPEASAKEDRRRTLTPLTSKIIMDKRLYERPVMTVVILQHQSRLLISSPQASLNGEEEPVEIEWP